MLDVRSSATGACCAGDVAVEEGWPASWVIVGLGGRRHIRPTVSYTQMRLV